MRDLRPLKTVTALAAVASAFLVGPAVAGAQETDDRWLPLLGCFIKATLRHLRCKKLQDDKKEG